MNYDENRKNTFWGISLVPSERHDGTEQARCKAGA